MTVDDISHPDLGQKSKPEDHGDEEEANQHAALPLTVTSRTAVVPHRGILL
jgi:hypothetical protein